MASRTHEPDSNPHDNLVRWACVGLGGYAGKMSDLLWDLSQSRALRYVAACDPAPASNPDRIAQLRSANVSVHDSLSSVLHSDAEAVWLPIPIDLHLAFTRAAVDAGKAVLCEKPAAGAPSDIDAMIAARDRAKRPVAIGFQHVYDPAIADVKKRLADGAIGTVRRATVLVAWPRDDHYYGRNTWAARWKRNDTWVLDSPANNAMAHYVHLALFLLGTTPDSSATPVRVQAEHYRANPIETYDTTALRATLATGVELLVYLTHASATTVDPQITLVGDRGTLTVDPEQSCRFGDTSIPLAGAVALRENMVATVSALARDLPVPTPVATLECARAQSTLVAASIQAAPVQPFPPSLISTLVTQRNGHLRAVAGIEAILRTCADSAKLPSETGTWPWAAPASTLVIPPHWRFVGPHASP
jgi:predicted dehydrogenase